MKKFSIISALMVLLAFWSCSKNDIGPTAQVNGGFVITTPSNNVTLTLNPYKYKATALTLNWTSADFGYSSSIEYLVQFALQSGDFAQATNAPALPYSFNAGTFNSSVASASYSMTNQQLNNLLKGLVPDVGTYNFKLRMVARPKGQISSPGGDFLFAYSQEINFTSNVYDTLLETPFIYVLSNFGTPSTFSPWDINDLGTANSPAIYSAAKDNVYTGFVYTDAASPQFKFANVTDEGIVGYGLLTNQTGIVPPLASNNSDYGALDLTTDLGPGAMVVTPPAPNGAGTYYFTVDISKKDLAKPYKYFVDKRTINVRGTSPLTLNQNLTYITDPTSPYYRMYTADVNFNNPGFMTIYTRGNLAPSDFNIGSDAVGTLVSNDGTKFKMKVGGNKVQIGATGPHKIILDLRNSAYYSLRIIPN